MVAGHPRAHHFCPCPSIYPRRLRRPDERRRLPANKRPAGVLPLLLEQPAVGARAAMDRAAEEVCLSAGQGQGVLVGRVVACMRYACSHAEGSCCCCMDRNACSHRAIAQHACTAHAAAARQSTHLSLSHCSRPHTIPTHLLKQQVLGVVVQEAVVGVLPHRLQTVQQTPRECSRLLLIRGA